MILLKKIFLSFLGHEKIVYGIIDFHLSTLFFFGQETCLLVLKQNHIYLFLACFVNLVKV
jgi:hypothetical protein